MIFTSASCFACSVRAAVDNSKKVARTRLGTERRVPKLIPVLGSQPVGDVSHKPGGRLPLLSARPAVTFPARRLVSFSLLGEQRHDGCEQFA